MAFRRILSLAPGEKVRFEGFGETGIFTVKEVVDNIIYFVELPNKALLVRPNAPAEWLEINEAPDFDVADTDEIIELLLLGGASYR